jgi:hypothetical protein
VAATQQIPRAGETSVATLSTGVVELQVALTSDVSSGGALIASEIGRARNGLAAASRLVAWSRGQVASQRAGQAVSAMAIAKLYPEPKGGARDKPR